VDFKGLGAIGGNRWATALDPPPGVFLRKSLILWELFRIVAQECDSKGFIAARDDSGADSEVSRGLVGTITTHDSMDC
jgi:hypothetical protein